MNIYDEREPIGIREINPLNVGTTRAPPVFDTKRAFDEWLNDYYRLREVRKHEEESSKYVTGWAWK